jgi:hypothetical protein
MFGAITPLMLFLQNLIFADMTRTLHLMPLESSDLDSDPSFNVIIAYEDFETGKRAKSIYDSLVENLGHDCQFTNQMWKFEVLGIPKLRELAARDAVTADILIVSYHGTELPSEFKAWVELWVAEPKHPIALVALLDSLEPNDPRIAETRAYLADVARRAQMEFFAQPGDVPQANQDFFALPRNLSVDNQLLQNLPGTAERKGGLSHWGINE